MFVGTGVTWWFSSSGASEWRFMNRMPERASQLRFGDFDGDGRTDVLAVHGQSMQVSWAGSSPWFTLAATRATLADLAIGDFDGDHFSDVFAANGREWTYASRGTTWTHLAWQSLRTSDVRLGDFTADGRTDVLGVIGGAWQIVRGGGAGAFELLGPARTATMAGLVVADFDGDAFADVARSTGSAWQISSRGTGAFSALRSSSDDITTLPIGRFDGPNRSADVVFWPSLHFGLAPAGRDPVVTMYSRQDMR